MIIVTRWVLLLRSALLTVVVTLFSMLASAACDCGSTDLENVCKGNSVSLTRGTSTITFQFECDGGECRCGRFANGYDYWVAPDNDGGDVSITGMTPEAIGSGADLRHGWIANPSTNAWGLDGRNYGGGTGDPLNPSAGAPAILNTSKGPVSVLKAKSLTGTGTSCTSRDVDGNERMCFAHVEVLTLMPRVPEGNGSSVLRPAWYGTTKSAVRVADVDLSFMPKLKPARPSGLMLTDWTKALSIVESVKFDWPGSYLAAQTAHAKWNYDGVKSGYTPGPHGDALEAFAMLLVDDSGNEAKKRLLALRVVQWGEDTIQIMKYHPLKSGRTYAGWPADGGHKVARYGPALFAAAAINDGGKRLEMFRLIKNSELERQTFPELNQHFQGKTQVLYGANSVSGGTVYYLTTSNTIIADPEGTQDGHGMCPGVYQDIAFPAMWTQAVVLKSMPKTAEVMDERYFAYVKRMVDKGTVCDDVSKSGLKPFGQCVAGADAGLVCHSNAHCPGSTCSYVPANYSNSQYNSILAQNVWFQYNGCLMDGTCSSGGPLSSAIPPAAPQLLVE